MKMDFLMIIVRNGEQIPISDTHRFILLLKGKGVFCFDNTRYEMSTHAFLEIPSNTECVFEADNNGSGFDDMNDSALLGVIVLPDLTYSSHKVMHIPGKDTDLIRRIFYLGLDVQGMDDLKFDTVRENLQRLMHETILAVGLKSKAMNQQVYDVIHELNMHFTDPDYDFKETLLRTGYSPNHLRKLFKEETGVTPADYITTRRMDMAAEMLRQYRTRIPVKDIAVQCGYKDPYYFSRQFKNYFGVSPQKYIEQL